MVLPLDGIKILDLSRMAPGPYCTMLLGDLGADVIKIEQPGFGIIPIDVDEETWAAYFALDRNKRSILLNLKNPEARQVFYKLVETADVILEGYRPGVVKQLGVDYDTVKKINPSIIYCSLSGYGQDGPYHDLPGHDINYIALAGALSAMGIRNGRPAVPLNLLADYAGGGQQAALGIVVALLCKERTGIGQYIDVAMLDGVIQLFGWEASEFFAGGKAPKWGDTPITGNVPCSNIYETKDGYVSIGCFEIKSWENLCHELKRDDLIPHQFATGQEKENIYSQLREIFLTKTKYEWFEIFSPKGIAVAPVLDLDEVFKDPHVLHRQMVVEVDNPKLGKVKQVGIGLKFSETPGRIRSTAPLPGQNTEEILSVAGYSVDEIKSLKETGATG